MRDSRTKRVFLIGAFLAAAVIVGAFTFYPADGEDWEANPEVKKATLLVTSVDPEESVTFDAVWKGTSLRNGGKVVGQETPFKIDVPAEAFQGLFRQSGGSGALRVRLTAQEEKGSGKWWSVGQDASVVMITANGGDRTAMGM